MKLSYYCGTLYIQVQLSQQVKLLTTDTAKLITTTGSVTTLRGLITSNYTKNWPVQHQEGQSGTDIGCIKPRAGAACFKWQQVLQSSVVRVKLVTSECV